MSFMRVTGPHSDTSYGWQRACIQMLSAVAFALTLTAAVKTEPAAADQPLKVVVLGDSLTAGYGLPEQDGFVPRLQAALAALGVSATIANAGVSGDTAADALARLDWSVPVDTQAVMVELGANDMLRGIDPGITRKALDTILRRLTARHVAVLLCGMRAAPNLGSAYGQAFERIYPELAAKYAVLLYPFFLDGVAANLKLTQRNGMHPNAAGVEVIVERILPKVEELIVRARALPPT